MYHSLFIILPAEVILGYFQDLVIINKTAENIGVQNSV